MKDALIKVFSDLHPSNLRYLFYLVTPNETTFTRMEDIPNYYIEPASTWTFALVLLEFLILDKKKYAFNDHVTSINGGILFLLLKVGGRDISASIYPSLYDRVHIIDLPLDSPLTWILAFFAMDLVFYIGHRAMHEIGVLWWFHKMHHSSEYFNLSTGIREPAIQDFAQMLPELLQAFIIPPNMFIVHRTLNLTYQFWIHTTVVPYLGPLEYFINTPSSHRVHHGRNPYCIDRNFACVLIIWDRIFGTYEAERKDEQIEYGLTKPVHTFDQLHNQFFELKAMAYDKGQMRNEKNEEMFPGFWNKVKAALLPPGYLPGMRTKWFFVWKSLEDNTAGVPEIKRPVVPYNPPLTGALQCYLFWQWLVLLGYFVNFVGIRFVIEWPEFLCRLFFLIALIQMFGYYFDHSRFALLFDTTRLMIAILIGLYLYDWVKIIYGAASLAVVFWLSNEGEICTSCKYKGGKCYC